jgi:hypothetical protein
MSIFDTKKFHSYKHAFDFITSTSSTLDLKFKVELHASKTGILHYLATVSSQEVPREIDIASIKTPVPNASKLEAHCTEQNSDGKPRRPIQLKKFLILKNKEVRHPTSSNTTRFYGRQENARKNKVLVAEEKSKKKLYIESRFKILFDLPENGSTVFLFLIPRSNQQRKKERQIL